MYFRCIFCVKNIILSNFYAYIIMNLIIHSASKKCVCYDASSVVAGLLHRSSQEGYYLLKNGSISPYTVYNQENGIFIDDALYLPLKMTKQPLTAKEAKLYADSLKVKLPDLYQIMRLKMAVQKVNSSLRKVGMEDFCLISDVLKNVWYKEALEEAASNETRRFVVISSYDKHYRSPSYKLIDENCLLFADTLLYQRIGDGYEPLRPVLKFTWSGMDFLSVYIGKDEYVFYRGYNLKLMFLGKNIDVCLLDDEVMEISGSFYQVLDGKLYKFFTYSGTYTFSCPENENDLLLLSFDNDCTIDGILESSGYFTYYFQKNEDGIFVEMDHQYVETYSRNH